jgi:hypothetical protein
MATITCKCGTVRIEFDAKYDLLRLECCCRDCTAALRYAHQRGGPAFPENQCLDSSWLPNDFNIVKGEEKLGAFMNFENAATTRFYCTDCWTVLLADHPAYAKKLVLTQAGNYKEFEGLRNIELMPPRARHFVKDLSKEQLAALPDWGRNPSNVYQGVADILVAQFPAIQQAGKEGVKMSAQILLAKIGGVFIPESGTRLAGEVLTSRSK